MYDYGRSPIGLTFDVPVKFLFNNKEMAMFHLYSCSPDLEDGVYSYNEKLVNTALSFYQYGCSDKTFFKGKCKWGNNIITGGTVTVERNNDDYTFVMDVVDNTGEIHYGIYQGKVKKENWHTKSNVNMFVAGGLYNCKGSMGAPVGTPQDFSGGISICGLETGDINKYIQVCFSFSHSDENSPTGTYNINPNANGYFYPDITVYVNYLRVNQSATFYKLTYGTFTITRVNKPHKFRIDVDAVAENGYIIKGCYDGGEGWFSCDYD